MRTVAVTFAALMMLAALPLTHAADECSNPGALSYCLVVPAEKPGTPPGVPPTPYWGKYYLWVGAGHCTGLISTLNDCRSWPYAPGSGIPLPSQAGGGTAPFPGLITMLFQESNGMTGLQRSILSSGGRPIDKSILV